MFYLTWPHDSLLSVLIFVQQSLTAVNESPLWSVISEWHLLKLSNHWDVIWFNPGYPFSIHHDLNPCFAKTNTRYCKQEILQLYWGMALLPLVCHVHITFSLMQSSNVVVWSTYSLEACYTPISLSYTALMAACIALLVHHLNLEG